MSIWFQKKMPSLEEMNKRGEKTLFSLLEMKFTKIGENFVEATMPISEKTMQPLGILNGGATAAFVESIASASGNYCIDSSKYVAVGLSINVSHLLSGYPGEARALLRAIHLGRRSQVWQVDVFQAEKQLATARMTMMIIERKSA